MINFVNSFVIGSNLKKKLLVVSTIQTLSFSSIDKPFAALSPGGKSYTSN